MSAEAIDLVLAVFADPSRIVDFRERPLPEGIGQVIRLAAGEAAALEAARQSTGAGADALAEASVFFLQQILFAPNADSYRVLGASADARQDRLRENYRWLMKWLHPDHHQDGWEAVYADRVNVAWQDLKTPERRRDYDRRASTAMVSLPVHALAPRRHGSSASARGGPLLSGAMVRRLPAIVLGTLGTLALALVAGLYWAQSDTERQLAERRQEQAAAAALAEIATAAANPVAPAPAAGPDFGAPGMPAAANVSSQQTAAAAPDAAPAEHAGAVVAMAPTVAPESAPAAAPSPSVTDEPVAAPVVAVLPVAPAPSGPSAQPALAAAPPSASPSATTGVETSRPPIVAQPERSPTDVVTQVAPAAARPAGHDDSAAKAVARAEPPATMATPVRAGAVPVARAEPSAAPVAPLPVRAEPVVRAEPPPAPAAPLPSRAEPLARAEPPAAPADSAAASLVAAAHAEPVASAAEAPAKSDAEALVREFAAAYAAGDLARFDRLFSRSGSQAHSRDQMRRRFLTTEMRYLEIHQLNLRIGTDDARASAHFRDTYVPRGARRAVTETGMIEWVILVDAGDARIAAFDRNPGRP